MKRLLLILTVSIAAVGAFAQGKVGFNNNSLHLVYWPLEFGSYGGTAINSDNLLPGISGMAADLYMGTSSGLLYLYSTASFGPMATGPGKWTNLSV